MKNRSFLVGVLFAALIPQWGYSLNLIDTYRLAYYNDPIYQAARSTYMASREAYPQARANLLPNLELDGEIARTKEEMDEGDTLNISSYRLTLTQRVLHVEDWFALKGADYSVKRAAAVLSAAQQDLMIRAATAYFNVLAAQDDLSFATAQKNQLSKQLHQTNQRFKVGVVAITDVKEAQSRFDSALSEEIGQKNALEDRREELRALIHQNPGILARLKRTIPLVKPVPENMEAWVATAEQQDYNLKAAKYAVQAAQQNKHEQFSGHLPTVDLVAYYEGKDQAFQRAQSATPFAKGWFIGLRGNLPIFQGFRTTSRTKQANYELITAQHNLETERRVTLNNTRNNYRGVLTGIAQVKALKRAVDSAKTALEAVEAGFTVGTKTNVDVLDRIADLFQQQQLHSAARYRYVLTSLQLKREAGTLSVPDLEHVNHWLVHHK